MCECRINLVAQLLKPDIFSAIVHVKSFEAAVLLQNDLVGLIPAFGGSVDALWTFVLEKPDIDLVGCLIVKRERTRIPMRDRFDSNIDNVSINSVSEFNSPTIKTALCPTLRMK